MCQYRVAFRAFFIQKDREIVCLREGQAGLSICTYANICPPTYLLICLSVYLSDLLVSLGLGVDKAMAEGLLNRGPLSSLLGGPGYL